ncbi:hypothetical protein [Agrococcus carbonis]|uniref:DUF998 domain-containing protein n=1 Tax=Agrococcus carbonis TaxID=684552 RepID=A0A1H1MVN4_9MICO|nr:hypothetical protein [Agrococcus carbonis]SDR90951.1 hypothetical protein SAMN04489719_1099 [Agrococcus carbonis]
MSGAGAVRVGPRPGRIALAAAGGAWALVSLPLTAADWGAPWVGQLSRIDPWRSVRAAVDEPYILFGALAGLSFLAIGLALLPSLWRGGWGGRVLAALVLAGAVVTPASYLSTPEESPLHALWGSEGPLLVLVGLAGIAAAFTARGWPTWLRVLLGATLPVLIAGVLATGYYPHGCLVALAIEAIVVVAAAPAAGVPNGRRRASQAGASRPDAARADFER